MEIKQLWHVFGHLTWEQPKPLITWNIGFTSTLGIWAPGFPLKERRVKHAVFQLYLYEKRKREKFHLLFCFAHGVTSKTSSLFIFINGVIKTYIQLYKYTVLNNRGACVCVHIHSLNYRFMTDPKPLIYVNKPWVQGTIPLKVPPW